MTDVQFATEIDHSGPLASWDQVLVDNPSTDLVSNVKTEVRLLRVEGHVLPITVNDGELDNSWVCSPYNGAVTYPLEELRLIANPVLRSCLRATAISAGLPLKVGRINRVVCVNNRLLSTNLYPKLSTDAIKLVLERLSQEFPRHAILFRSLNDRTDSELLRCLSQHGCFMAPSRQVYFYDGGEPSFLDRSNTKTDTRLLNKTHYRLLTSREMSDACPQRVKELYDHLYIEKYSIHNPQFSSRMMEFWLRDGALRIFGLSAPDGRLDGVVGSWIMDGVRTVPLVGYDTSLAKSLGLYRMLMAQVLQETAERGELLNLSAGASHFKRLRGGKPVIEYSAVYCQHLGLRQRMIWKMLASLLNRIGKPVLQRLEL